MRARSSSTRGPVEQRRRDGEIPGALLIDRNVLEWRLDPASDARIPEAADHDIDGDRRVQRGLRVEPRCRHAAGPRAGRTPPTSTAGSRRGAPPAFRCRPRRPTDGGSRRQAHAPAPRGTRPAAGESGAPPVDRMHRAADAAPERHDHDRAQAARRCSASGAGSSVAPAPASTSGRIASRCGGDHGDLGRDARVRERLVELATGRGAGQPGDERGAARAPRTWCANDVRAAAGRPRAGPARRAGGRVSVGSDGCLDGESRSRTSPLATSDSTSRGVVGVGERDVDGRVRDAERADQRRRRDRPRGWGASTRSRRPPSSPTTAATAASRGLDVAQHLAGRLDQRLAGRGEHHPSPDPVEQRGAQLGLELADRLRDRGLRHELGFGRPGEAAVVDHREEEAELAEIHR